MTGTAWGELHGPVHLTPRASRRARHARAEDGEGMVGVVMIAANAIGLALVGWIGVGELTTARAVSAAGAPDQATPVPCGLDAVRRCGSPILKDAR